MTRTMIEERIHATKHALKLLLLIERMTRRIPYLLKKAKLLNALAQSGTSDYVTVQEKLADDWIRLSDHSFLCNRQLT